ncbi:MAG TPA: LuxR C-terminal-related transcriptional regulator [Gaiellaceae bacterium]|nr:LuxR C-terminal-related transcriptional regulator [Gaiellaceae bacterium]
MHPRASRTIIATNAARASPAELKRTFQALRVPSFLADRTGQITWANGAATAALGHIVGKPLGGFVAPEDVDTVRRKHDLKVRGEVEQTDYEIDVLMRSGLRRRAEISSIRVAGDHDCCAVFGVVLPQERRIAPRIRPNLTPRQHEVLVLLGDGLSTAQIAGELHLSPETVRNHVRGLLRALGVHSRVEALAAARNQGLLPD